MTQSDFRVEFAHQPIVKRQFCRVGAHGCTPTVTLTFDNGTRRLHWCAEHAADAERYRKQADQ